MNILIAAVLPIALVALTGVFIGRRLQPDDRTLARVTLYVLFPALVLHRLSRSTLAVQSAVGIIGAMLIHWGLLYGVAIAAGRLLKYSPNDRKSLIAITLFGNTGNMGLPFTEFALGMAALERAIIYMITSATLIASFAPVALKGEGIRSGLKFTLRLPIFWAAMGGLLLQGFALQLPQALERSLDLMGAAAIPVALLTLGIQLSQTPFAFGWAELFSASLRLFVSPAIAYGSGRLLGLSGLDLQVLVIQAAMPVAVSSVIWVSELGGDTAQVARTVVLSTLLSFGTLPLVLWMVL